MSDINNTEAYAVFDSSDGSLTFFRDTPGLYTNNQVDGTKTYYTGIETRTETGSSNAPWYSNRTSVQSVTFDDPIAPKSTVYWFSGMNNANFTSITGLEKLNTSNVTDMKHMFYNCRNLTSFNLSQFNTSNVTDMYYMFRDCQNLTSLDLSRFDTSNVIDMRYMFYLCQNLTSLDLSHFDTSNVRNMSYMFGYCQNLTSLDVSHFNTSNVINMLSMFHYCNNLTSLDVSHFDTSNVTNMISMFSRCSSLTSLDVSHFDTSNVTSMNSMFAYCSNLTSLDVSHFDTSNVTNMGDMFYHCQNLTSLNVSHFDTSNVTTMLLMFRDCSNLTSLDLSHFNTSNVTSMSYMFYNCNNLTFLDISHFDTNNITNMSWMFYYCSKLITTLNIMHMPSSFNSMCIQAATDSGSQITLQFVPPVSNSDVDILVSTKSSESNVINGGQGTFILPAPPLPLKPLTPPKKIEKLFKISQILPDNIEYVSSTILSSTGKNILTVPTYDSLSHRVLADIWSTDLDYVGELIILNIKTLANNDVDLILETKKTKARVTDDIIYSNPIEKDPYVGLAYAVFDSSDGSLKFFRDEEGKYTNNQVDGTKTYYTSIETLEPESYSDVPWYNLRTRISVTNITFEDAIAPISTAYWFYGMTNVNLTSISNLEKLNTSKVTNMTQMFSYCNKLTSLDLSNFNTSNVTNMSRMFYDCANLISLDLSSFNTSNVTNMSRMFYECTNLTNLDLNSFNTSKVIDMSYMFCECTNLTNLDLNSFNTSKVINMSYMFSVCTHLTSLDLSSFNTFNVTDINNMFSGCTNLTSLDLSNFNTFNVIYMHFMFCDCTHLTSLDLSSFNTFNVTDMTYMFSGCNNLTTIYTTNSFNVSNVTNSDNMFYDDTDLVGAAGTTYNSSKTNATYAVVDNITGPGYFTDKTRISPKLAFTAYTSGDKNPIQLRKSGHLYQLTGNIKPTATIDASATTVICHLPDAGSWPTHTQYYVCTEGTWTWLLQVQNNGDVTCTRMRGNSTSFSNFTATSHLEFSATWMTDGEGVEKITLSPNSSYFGIYGDDSPYNDIVLRREGNVCFLSGVLKPTTTLTSTSTYTITTIPEGYRPSNWMDQLQQGSTTNRWELIVTQTGTVSERFYGYGTTAVNPTTAHWLPFCITWIVNHPSVTVQLLSFNSTFIPYAADSYWTERVKKTGNICSIDGTAKAAAAITASNTTTILTIPEDFRPSSTYTSMLKTGIGYNSNNSSRYDLRVDRFGALTMKNTGYEGSLVNAAASSWWCTHMIWIQG